MTGQLMTARDVAEFLNLSVASVLRKTRAGTIPGFKIDGVMRYDPDEIAAYLEQHRTNNNGASQ